MSGVIGKNGVSVQKFAARELNSGNVSNWSMNRKGGFQFHVDNVAANRQSLMYVFPNSAL